MTEITFSSMVEVVGIEPTSETTSR